MKMHTDDIPREELHLRQIQFRGWRRGDGLFEIEASLTDRKPHDFRPPSDVHVVAAGDAIHDLGRPLVIGADMVVREVRTTFDAYPYRQCNGGGESLQALIGLKIGAGWSGEVRKRLPTGDTCAHLRELLIPLASAATIALTSARNPADLDALGPDGTPRKIDTCYAYGASRELVLQRWPSFHKPAP